MAEPTALVLQLQRQQLQFLKTQWGYWTFDSSTDELVIEIDDLASAHNELIDEMDKAARWQKLLMRTVIEGQQSGN